MRVAILAYSVKGRTGGIGYYVENLSRELRKLGVSVDTFYPPFCATMIGPVLNWFRNMTRDLRNYDVVHSNETAGVLVPHDCIVETFHHRHLFTGQRRYIFFNRLEYLACMRACRIIAPSEATARDLRVWGAFSDKVSIIRHGVDTNTFRKDSRLREAYRKRLGLSGFSVITVGRLVKYKGHVDVVKALEAVPKSTLILVGIGNELESILREAIKRNVHVLHFDYVSQQELVGLYNCADVYVHTSALEGFGLTVLEAMACGLPVIAYDVGDFRNIVADSGVLIEKFDPQAIADKLMILFKDQALLNSLSSKAIVQSRKFSWIESARKHLKLYLEAAKV